MQDKIYIEMHIFILYICTIWNEFSWFDQRQAFRFLYAIKNLINYYYFEFHYYL